MASPMSLITAATLPIPSFHWGERLQTGRKRLSPLIDDKAPLSSSWLVKYLAGV